MSAAPSQPKTHAVVAGRYRLDEVIGEGGMAEVWRASDGVLHRPVAVKFLTTRGGRDDDRVARFTREARIGAAVRHPNVVDILDFGTMGETPYMVMELLDGESLEERMLRQPPLSLEELIGIACSILDGLAAVHRAGIVHRDLKPDNVFLVTDEDGTLRPKLLDFGVSRTVDPQAGRRSVLTTSDGRLVGTPEYMAPEQARGKRDIDLRVDIYALGVILYEGITGDLPFTAEGVGDLIIEIVAGDCPKVVELRPDAGAPISDVIERAMSVHRDDRYANAMEMKEALLLAAAQSFGVVARPSLPVAIPARHMTGLPAVLSTPRRLDSVGGTLPPAGLQTPFDGAQSGTRPVYRTPHPSTSPTTTDEDAFDDSTVEVEVEAPRPPGIPAELLPAPMPIADPPSPARPRWPLALGAVTVLAAVGGAGWWLLSTGAEPTAATATAAATPARAPASEPVADEPEPDPPAPTPQAAVEDSEPAAEAAEQSVVRITLRGLPHGARVAVDREWAEVEDGVVTLPQDDAEHTIDVGRGFRRWSARVYGTVDRTLIVRLRRPGGSESAAPDEAGDAEEAEQPAERPSRNRSGVFTDLDY